MGSSEKARISGKTYLIIEHYDSHPIYPWAQQYVE